MNYTNFEILSKKLSSFFGDDKIISTNTSNIQPYLEVAPLALKEICQYLYHTPGFYFDFLNNISAVDLGPENGHLELWYHLSSIPLEQAITLKITLERGEITQLPEVDSLTDMWKTADWHEREAYDLMGINFLGHPDLRRILLPADWQGHPLRKDYATAENYHGIKIKY